MTKKGLKKIPTNAKGYCACVSVRPQVKIEILMHTAPSEDGEGSSGSCTNDMVSFVGFDMSGLFANENERNLEEITKAGV